MRHLYDVILEDDRHEDVRLLMAEETEERDFPDWAMGFDNLTDLPEDEMPEGFADLDSDRFTSEGYTDDPSFAHQTLLGFKNRSFT